MQVFVLDVGVVAVLASESEFSLELPDCVCQVSDVVLYAVFSLNEDPVSHSRRQWDTNGVAYVFDNRALVEHVLVDFGFLLVAAADTAANVLVLEDGLFVEASDHFKAGGSDEV